MSAIQEAIHNLSLNVTVDGELAGRGITQPAIMALATGLTFKQAEAYSLLGDADRAVDCATRAFVQGFSCARWYETSPFLEKMRTHPRWPTLRRNVRERQAVLEGSFPPSSFEP